MNGQSHQVIARKYRPTNFSEVVGQPYIVQTLQNAIGLNRVGHAYLFVGTRGVGKTTLSRLLTQGLLCQSSDRTHAPCSVCESCQKVANGTHLDVNEIDGASNRGVDDVRKLKQEVSLKPTSGNFKVFVIDEIHMLTKEAFNALLLTLEEPADHVKFLFCTTEPDKLPETILSRCQRFDLAPVSVEQISENLEIIAENEDVIIDSEAIAELARQAHGSVRDGQSLLEQVISFGSALAITIDDVHRILGTATAQRLIETLECLTTGRLNHALLSMTYTVQEGTSELSLAIRLLAAFNDLLLLVAGCGTELLRTFTEAETERLATVANAWTTEGVIQSMDYLDHAIQRMKSMSAQRVYLEMALVKINQVAVGKQSVFSPHLKPVWQS